MKNMLMANTVTDMAMGIKTINSIFLSDSPQTHLIFLVY